MAKKTEEIIVNEDITGVTEEPQTETKVESKAKVTPPSYKPKKKIPMDEFVAVTSNLNGTLVYVSKATMGYKEIWNGRGDTIYMTMFELSKMSQTDRRFFTDNWISVDVNVLRDLNMDRYYTDMLDSTYIDKLFSLSPEKITERVVKLNDVLKNSVGLEAENMITEGKLTDIRIITALEKALNCELYER